MTLTVFAYRIAAALAMGALVGSERQIRRRSAGLVTNALVSTGACVFVLVSESVISPNNPDNLRVVSQVVTGIGFLGAGVIMKDGFNVHGLNTAATLWCAAAIGCLCGYGLWKEAVVAAVAVLLINWLLKWASAFFDKAPVRNKHDNNSEKSTKT